MGLQHFIPVELHGDGGLQELLTPFRTRFRQTALQKCRRHDLQDWIGGENVSFFFFPIALKLVQRQAHIACPFLVGRTRFFCSLENAFLAASAGGEDVDAGREDVVREL